MKKILLSITAIALLAISAKAQAPDFGFENWVSTPSPSSSKDPQGWVSFNTVTYAGMPRTVFEETVSPFAGTISAKIVTDVLPSFVYIKNPNEPGKNFDTVGVLAIGKFTTVVPPVIAYGYPISAAFPRPSTLSFHCKYAPVGGDSAFVLAYLTKNNGGKRDTIATGKFASGAVGAYALNSLTMNYNPAFQNVMPDSQQVFISSSFYSKNGARKGSTFWIDDLAWSGYVGINDIAGNKNSISVFPNPTNGQVNFNATVNVSMIEITDITGRLIGSYKTMDNHLALQTAGFVPGVYLYAVLNDKKEVVNRGKFEVTK